MRATYIGTRPDVAKWSQEKHSEKLNQDAVWYFQKIVQGFDDEQDIESFKTKVQESASKKRVLITNLLSLDDIPPIVLLANKDLLEVVCFFFEQVSF